MNEGLNLSKDDWDKISEMPDNILLHMMNFMDTREAVQTCVLSKRWNNLWKRLTSLLFNSSKFGSVVKIINFLYMFLSDRDDSISLSTVYLDLSQRPRDSTSCLGFLITHAYDWECLNRLMKYAVSHNCQRLSIKILFLLQI